MFHSIAPSEGQSVLVASPDPEARVLIAFMLRRLRYEVTTFGANIPERSYELRETLNKPVNFEGIKDRKTTLEDALSFLEQAYGVKFVINERAFKAENLPDIGKTQVANPDDIPPMHNVALGTVLKKILSRIPVPAPAEATWLIRREVIEITTSKFQTAEKTIRVYPVADLVIQETAGVAGQVTSVGVLFSNASTTIEGPGEFDSRYFGATDLRIAARGTLTLPEVGIHFAGRLRDQLPATLRFTVNFRDENNHRISSEVGILSTPP